LAFLPKPPDGADDEALESTVCLSSRLAFGDFTVQVGPGGRQMMSLREDDEVENVVEASDYHRD
jgi:hypothetical protein